MFPSSRKRPIISAAECAIRNAMKEIHVDDISIVQEMPDYQRG